jgi:hypothetical protein
MSNHAYNLECITDLEVLVDIKENLKKDVLDPNLKWYERLELYQAIQNINKRIAILSTGYFN